jgi:F-type H+-transporting ATPase subunit beta
MYGVDDGQVGEIIGPVVDIVASGTTTEQVAVTVSQAIRVQGVTCEVQQLLGEGTIRCVAMEGTEGLRRGEEADVFGLAYRCSCRTSYAWSDFPNVLGAPIEGGGDVIRSASVKVIPLGFIRFRDVLWTSHSSWEGNVSKHAKVVGHT